LIKKYKNNYGCKLVEKKHQEQRPIMDTRLMLKQKNGDKSWSILRISQEVSTERVDWNNNSNMSYISSWNERVECFIAPTGNLGNI
jgi:hypothetical protein